MRIRQSLCYSLFKPEGSSLAEFFREARDMGYAAIEFWFRDKMGDDWEEVVGTAREQGLAVASRCGHHSLAKGLNDPAGHERIEAELRASIEVAARHGPIS